MIPHSTSDEWQKGEQTQDHNDKAGSVLQRRLNRYLNGWKTVSICLLEFASDSAFVAFFRQFSIFQKSDGTFLGETGLANFHRGIDENFENCVEASWVISRSAQGAGVAKEAAVAAHQWFVHSFSPSKTICLIAKNNIPSIRVAEHVGYRIYDECLYKGAECLKLECLWDK
ncbi:GNAT family N-acetyltransferase [Citrobacter koseri]